jgi:hypothetical protein
MEQPAFSLCEVVCDLDIQIDRLNALGYWEEAAALHVVSKALTGSVELRLVGDPPAGA